MEDNNMEQFVDTFKSLSDETRLRILYLLIASDEAVCVCEIVDTLEGPQYNISKHLKILKSAGLVEETKEGRWKYYSLTKNRDLFTTHLFQTVSTISMKSLIKDYKKLKKRLKIRRGGKCVAGIQNLHSLPMKVENA
jgi:ArsR family transcriptional regulator